MTGKILTLIREKAGAIHWWGAKITSLALIPIVLYLLVDISIFMNTQTNTSVMVFVYAFFNQNPILLLITSLVLLWHIKSGIETILEDYVHGEKIKIVSIFLVRIATIQIIKYIYLCCIIF